MNILLGVLGLSRGQPASGLSRAAGPKKTRPRDFVHRRCRDSCLDAVSHTKVAVVVDVAGVIAEVLRHGSCMTAASGRFQQLWGSYNSV